ncbi:MAG: carbohydrate ABC transporter permease [Candidatus Humimicrobiaceae bacterium]
MIIKSVEITVRKKNSYHRFERTPYVLLTPALIIIFAVLIIPILYAIFLSFTDSNLLKLGKASFIGLKNFETFFISESLSKVLYATSVYVVGGVSLTFFIGLGVAWLLNNSLKPNFLFRGIAILPWAVPQVVLVLIWKWMLNPQNGVLNFFLHKIGLIPKDFSWLSNVHFAILAILMVTIWKQYPLSFMILLAGMKTIPNELYEAASIDGANGFQKFIHITLPGLRYVISVLLLLLTIWSFGNFVIIWLMTQGGPADRTSTLTIFTYLNSFKFNKLGYGASIGVLCLLVSFVFSIIYYKVFIKKLGTE